MFGIAKPEARQIKVIFLDQGISIPVSLPRSWMWRTIGPVVGAEGGSDSDRISSAMAYGVTRHKGQEQRGCTGSHSSSGYGSGGQSGQGYGTGSGSGQGTGGGIASYIPGAHALSALVVA